MRRGRPTLAAEHGIAVALNAGDGLAVVAARCCAVPPTGWTATSPTSSGVSSTRWRCGRSRVRATEVGWQLDDVADLGPENYLELIMHKTCWYTTIHPLRVGAIVVPGGQADLGPLVRWFHFGAAFQIPRRSAQPHRR